MKKHMVQLLLFYYSKQIWVSAPKVKKKKKRQQGRLTGRQVHLRQTVPFQDDTSNINYLGYGHGLTYLWTWGLGAACLLDGLLMVGRVFHLGNRSPKQRVLDDKLLDVQVHEAMENSGGAQVSSGQSASHALARLSSAAPHIQPNHGIPKQVRFRT